MQIEREYFGPVNRSGRNKPQQEVFPFFEKFPISKFPGENVERGRDVCDVHCSVMKGRW